MTELPSYQEIKKRLPARDEQKRFIEVSRQTISSILKGEEARILLILGPCSIHDIKSAREYAYRLKNLSESISKHFFIVMRTYCEKARSTFGWKGLLYDPFLDNSHAIEKGIEITRSLLLEMADLQLPTATEFLDPLTAPYYEDLISWGSIGARTSSSQPHRQLASGLKMPIGLKNGVAGNISSAINGVISASQPHSHVSINEKGQPCLIRTEGNQDLHIVLRGGDSGPNYDVNSIAYALQELKNREIPQRIVVDCSHQNSGKIYSHQKHVFQSLIDQILEGNKAIRGIMLESHLFEGKQALKSHNNELEYGVSITDACLSWDETSQLIQEACKKIQNSELLCIK